MAIRKKCLDPEHQPRAGGPSGSRIWSKRNPRRRGERRPRTCGLPSVKLKALHAAAAAQAFRGDAGSGDPWLHEHFSGRNFWRSTSLGTKARRRTFLWHTFFCQPSHAPKNFSGNSRDSLLNFLDELRIKTRHVNHPGEDASNERAANQTRRTNRRSWIWKTR